MSALQLSLSAFSQVSIYEIDKRDCRKFCTTGIDGAMTIWDFKVCFLLLCLCELVAVITFSISSISFWSAALI